MSLLKKKPESGEGGDSGDWLITFSDLMTLLLAFFVLLYSMSKLDMQKYNAIMKSLNVTLTHKKAEPVLKGHVIEEKEIPEEAENIETLEDLVNNELEAIMQKINAFIYSEDLQSKIKTYIDDRGVVIKIADDILFTPGQADLSSTSRSLLNYLLEIVNQFPYPIRVEGHTDNTPISTAQFPSNWELSTIRATNVVRYFISQGLDAKLFSAEGFAEYRPIAGNKTPSGRAKNRRVEIVYKKDKILEIIKKKKR